MPPLTPKTLTRLDPAVPLLWRDGRTIQFGDDGDLRIDVGEPWVEPLLTRMATGFRRAGFDVVAHAVGAPRDEARMLLARLQDRLVDDPVAPRAAWVESIDIADARCEYRMREALADEGVPGGDRGRPDHVGVILVEGAAAALQLARYLREDVPHLPVAIERGRTTVGPLVLPGASPCLSCRDGHARDRDPAWPRMHAQLVGRGAGVISAARIGEAATLAARLLRQPDAGGASVEVSADGERVWRSVTFHAECRCRDLSSPSPRGSATAPVPLDRPSATTRVRAFARPA